MNNRSSKNEGIGEQLHVSRLMIEAVHEDYFGDGTPPASHTPEWPSRVVVRRVTGPQNQRTQDVPPRTSGRAIL